MSKQQKKKLTLKQHRFVVAYMGKAKGNATEAARIAEYSGTDRTLGAVGKENLEKPCIQAAIKKHIETSEGIASRDEILKFWSDMLRDGKVSETHRIRCAENLAKCYAMFIERQRVEGSIKIDTTRDELLKLIQNGTIVDQLEQIENALLLSDSEGEKRPFLTKRISGEIDA